MCDKRIIGIIFTKLQRPRHFNIATRDKNKYRSLRRGTRGATLSLASVRLRTFARSRLIVRSLGIFRGVGVTGDETSTGSSQFWSP